MLEGLARLDLLVLAACLPGLALSVVPVARLERWVFHRY